MTPPRDLPWIGHPDMGKHIFASHHDHPFYQLQHLTKYLQDFIILSEIIFDSCDAF